jgi:glycosyltransferase involved in cell wall biosynthesis
VSVAAPSPLRIAWLGPAPSDGGGATYVGTQLLAELGRRGHEVHCFLTGTPGDVAPHLWDVPGLQFHFTATHWSWGRWYSRQPLLALLSGQLARARGQLKVTRTIVERHRERPYDVVYQFSQSEHSPLRRRRSELPPIVVHPSTHAASELRWAVRERKLARRGEPLWRSLLVQAVFVTRTVIQRYELPRADRVLAVSRVFAAHLARDYRISADRLGVVINPVDLRRFHPVERSISADEPIRLLFVSRMSMRKGVEMVVELSHRLSDLRGDVRIDVVGGPSLWSNYVPLLDGLDSAVATYHGALSAEALAHVYAAAQGLIQPSLYEPFGLTVAEALASGLPVVASDEVGAIDGVDHRVCRSFPSGDVDAFEVAVRNLVADLKAEGAMAFTGLARGEAKRLFAADVVGDQLVAELRIAASSRGSAGV